MKIKFNKEAIMEMALQGLDSAYRDKLASYGDNPLAIKNRSPLERETLYKTLADVIFGLSQIYVPVDTGYLKQSGKVVRNNIGTYSIVYSAPYALFVHEIIDNQHTPPTKAKFLEDAAWEVITDFDYIPFTFTIDAYGSGGIALNIDSVSFKDFSNDLLTIKHNHEILNSNSIGDLDLISTNFSHSEVRILDDTN